MITQKKPFNHFDFYSFISIIYFGPNSLYEYFDVILLQILLMMSLLLMLDCLVKDKGFNT